MSPGDFLLELQHRVEELHGTDGAPDVRRFVVGEADRRAIPGAREGVPEQLFVRQDPAEPDSLELALYIAPRVFESLARDDPRRRLHAGNLDDYWIALEGVSHFVLVSARAELGRPVTALELEIQAEVDKFVTAWDLLRDQGAGPELASRRILRRLFGPYALREPMPRDEADRYHVATRVAGSFCRELAGSFGNDRERHRVHRAVRRFVRLGLADKIRAA